MSMIQNPKKEVIINYPISEIEVAINKLPMYIKKCTLTNTNKLIKETTLNFTEPLSVGANLKVRLESISEDKTKVVVDAERVIGSYDKSIELQYTNEHIELLFKTLSVLLESPETSVETFQSENETSNIGAIIGGVVIFAIIMLFIMVKK